MNDLRKTLETTVVEPIFRRLEAEPPADSSLPAVVFENRRRRARTRLLDALVSRGSARIPRALERKTRSLAREWAGAAFDDGFGPIEEFEIESARERDLVAALESGDPERIRAVHDRRLRRRVIEEFGSIELRGIQTTHRVLQDLNEVYVPLYLERPAFDHRAQTPQKTEVPGDTFVIDIHWRRTPVYEALRKHRYLLIVGAPGSGKSTLVAYLASRAAAGQLADELGEKRDPLPLVLVVRALDATTLTPSSLAKRLATEVDLVENALVTGKAILFVDGLDEAPEATRAKLIASLTQLIKRYPDVLIVATSRPAGEPGQIEGRLPDLAPFRLSELSQQDVGDFIDKWCLAAESSVRKDLAAARKAAAEAAKDLKSRIARSRSVQRIAVNPLLTSILCVVHRFLGHSIPEHRATLYEKCTDALLYEWEKAKFPEGAAIGELDAHQKRRLLMGVARSLHDEYLAEIGRSRIEEHFAEVLPSLGRPREDAERMITEIRDRSGLLVERRPGYFAFSHLTFQEYLSALDIVRTEDLEQLIDRFEDPWWHEVILLAAGVPGSDPERLVSRLLAKDSAVATVLAAQSVETAIEMPLKIRRRIENKLADLLPPSSHKSANRIAQSGAVVAPLLIKSLANKQSADDTVFLLQALAPIDYNPAIPAIAQCVLDQRMSRQSSPLGIDRLLHTSVGEYALFVLIKKALASRTALSALKGALLEYINPAFLNLLIHSIDHDPVVHALPNYQEVAEQIRHALKSARLDKPHSRPAANTG